MHKTTPRTKAAPAAPPATAPSRAKRSPATAPPRAKRSPAKAPAKKKALRDLPRFVPVSVDAPAPDSARPVSDDVAFALSIFAYASNGLSGPGVEARAKRDIEAALVKAAPRIGRWELTWGPAVQKLVVSPSAVSTMFVVRSLERPDEHVIAIAGSNPTSSFNWLVEDLRVATLIPWEYAPFLAPSAAIAQGTAIGLTILQLLTPSGDRKGAGTDVRQHLSKVLASGGGSPSGGRARVMVTGHSLGGALAPVLAQWLSDTRDSWDPDRLASVSTTIFASPSPGNTAFSQHCGGAHGVHPRRLWGSLDVVPHAWEQALLDDVPALYEPFIPTSAVIVGTTVAAKLLALSNYEHVDPEAPPLPFKVERRLVVPFVSSFFLFGAQMIHQHLLAYYPFFRFDPSWAPWFDFLVRAERAALLGFGGLAPDLPLSRSRALANEAPARKVLVGRKLVSMPAHPRDAQAAVLAREIQKALAARR